MNFLELAELAYEKVNRRPVKFSSIDLGKATGGDWYVSDPEERGIIRATRDAFHFIMSLSSHWDFMQVRGELLVLVAGQEQYDASQYANVSWDSLYIAKIATGGRYPIIEQDYLGWQELQKSVKTPSGIPNYLVKAPQWQWLFWPIPLEAFRLYGDGRYMLWNFEDANDEPPWDEARHQIIADVAASLWEKRLDSTDDAVQQLNVKVSNETVLHQLNGLLRDYTKGFG